MNTPDASVNISFILHVFIFVYAFLFPFDTTCVLKLEFVRKRYHKDILCSPVLMLNFCPDLLSEPLELHRATRELLFLVDRSGSMSGTNIQRVKVS